MQPTILVTGARGQLGSEIRSAATEYPEFRFLFAGREELPVTDRQAVLDYFRQHQPDYCINCAAYTAVDKAEDPLELPGVQALNADAVSYLAEACRNVHSRLIQISTDYVFDGTANRPYKETDPTGPVSVYGRTKLEGEQRALQLEDSIVIRTAWVYSRFGNNFVKTMLRLMQSRPELNVVADQLGSPTYAADLAIAILKIIASGKWVGGIYHYSNEGQISWFEFAQAIREISGAECTIQGIPGSEYPTAAQRPAWSVLDKSRIKSTWNLEIPEWKSSLETCIRLLKSESAASGS
ncbi:dTDP-4-dehydrorhamnose reductase [Niabella terrae]